MTAEARVYALLAAYVALQAAQRLGELAIARRHERALIAAGAVERFRGHFAFMVAVHVLYLPALVAEVVLLGARPGSLWPAWLGLWIAAQLLRYSAIAALGHRWHVRIWVVPGAPLVRSGVYRWLRHPNYVAVAIEMLAGPLLFGAWRTAVGISALDAIALTLRIRAEERALREAGEA